VIYPPVNPYVVGHLYSVFITFNGGNCDGRIGVGNIKAVA
jgi:glycerol-3-phosphate acyltransferase PlsY